MPGEINLSFMDKPEIIQRLFPRAFDLGFLQNTPPGSTGADVYFVDVDPNNRMCCHFYDQDKNFPSILYFHGSNEISIESSTLATHLTENGVNFFMTDYRGYGLSDGAPTMTNLLQDCHRLFEFFHQLLIKEGYNPSLFVMGRSLGSLPAIEVAYHHQKDLRGLIVESGSAQNFKSVWQGEADQTLLDKLSEAGFYNKDKIKEITIPTLITHGELDNLIPVQIGKALFELSGAAEKQLMIIPKASHNDLIEKGYEDYFAGLQEFVKKYSRKPGAKKTTVTKSAATRTKTRKRSSKN
jgi:alpha-beta hydrolase superfamily lysophospholipase